jgi:cysteine-rich repeat protein
MSSTRTQTTTRCLLGSALGVLALLGLNDSATQAQIEPGSSSTPVLGVTPSKTPKVAVLSVRDARFPGAVARDATGDTYDAAGLIQDSGSAYYVDDLPDSHTFGTGEESAGANMLSGVDTRIVGTDFGPGLPDTNLLQVNYFTADGSDIVPAGNVSPDGLIFEDWRLDVGTAGAGTDKINLTPNPGFTIVDSGICLLQDGVIEGCFALTLDDSDANGLSGAGVVGLGGADIAGYGIDEMIMYWEIQLNATATCGNGIVETGETCEDGNTISGDGCSSTCQTEPCTADINRDGRVDLEDYAILQLNFTGP